MSGIAGIIRVDGKPIELAEIANMTAAMEYRGLAACRTRGASDR